MSLSMPEDSSVDDAALALKIARERIAEFKATIEAQSEAKKAAAKRAYDLEQAAYAAKREAQEIETSLFDIRRAIRQAEKDAESAERRMSMQAEHERMRNEYALVEAEFSDILNGFAYTDLIKTHQISGAMKMAHSKRAILADGMGLGKTLTSIVAADLVKAKKILVLAPNTVVRSFEREIKRWAPHRTVVSLAGTNKHQRRLVAGSILPTLDSFIVTLNYEAWRKDKQFIQDLIGCEFDTVIADEAHNIKDTKSIAFQGVRDIVYAENLPCDARKMGSRYCDCEFGAHNSVKNVFPMTGTPILNRPQDLFPLLHLVDRVNFMTEYNFLADYCYQDASTSKWYFMSGGLDRLSRKISDKFIRRTKKDAGLDLPDKTVVVHDIILDAEQYPAQYRACKQLRESAAIELGDNEYFTVAAMIALITRQRQAITWPEGMSIKDKEGNVLQVLGQEYAESVKIDTAIDLVDEVILDEKVVIFSQFTKPLHVLKDRLTAAGHRVAIIEGATPVPERDLIIQRFQDPDFPVGSEFGIDILLGNYKAMGVGVTLTAATQMIILDEEWNPGKNEQAYDRIHRIGQQNAVTINILRVVNSIDTWMAALNAEKAEMNEGFVEATDLQQRLRDMILNGDM